MSKKDDALKLARAFIKEVDYPPYDDKPVLTAIDKALTEDSSGTEQPAQDQGQSCYCPNCEALSKELAALKAQQQEPVAAQCKFDGETLWAGCSIEHYNLVKSEPEKWPQYQARLLYTSPPASKPLTNAQIGAVAADIWGSILIAPQSYQAFARAIEAAHGTSPQPAQQQEPVAQEWRYYFSHSGATGKPDEVIGPLFTDRKEVAFGVGCFDQTALCPPASKPWVGLTDEDILRTKGQFKGTLDVQFDKFAYALEAKLREKNA